MSNGARNSCDFQPAKFPPGRDDRRTREFAESSSALTSAAAIVHPVRSSRDLGRVRLHPPAFPLPFAILSSRPTTILAETTFVVGAPVRARTREQPAGTDGRRHGRPTGHAALYRVGETVGRDFCTKRRRDRETIRTAQHAAATRTVPFRTCRPMLYPRMRFVG